MLKVLSILLLVSQFTFADTRYQMRVDGLACPYCAYGIEKKFKSIEGVSNIKVDLKNGLVTVTVATGKLLTEEQLKRLFSDSGFTYRSTIKTEIKNAKNAKED